jgi:hypothetical protein
VTCEAEGGREKTARTYFWVERQWEHRRAVSVCMAEVEQFAEQIWLYLMGKPVALELATTQFLCKSPYRDGTRV